MSPEAVVWQPWNRSLFGEIPKFKILLQEDRRRLFNGGNAACLTGETMVQIQVTVFSTYLHSFRIFLFRLKTLLIVLEPGVLSEFFLPTTRALFQVLLNDFRVSLNEISLFRLFPNELFPLQKGPDEIAPNHCDPEWILSTQSVSKQIFPLFRASWTNSLCSLCPWTNFPCSECHWMNSSCEECSLNELSFELYNHVRFTQATALCSLADQIMKRPKLSSPQMTSFLTKKHVRGIISHSKNVRNPREKMGRTIWARINEDRISNQGWSVSVTIHPNAGTAARPQALLLSHKADSPANA
jgi:hypothetical protein